MKVKNIVLASFIVCISVWACKKESEPTPVTPIPPVEEVKVCTDTTNYTFDADIQPMLVTHCSGYGCHNGSSGIKNLNINDYQSVVDKINDASSQFVNRIKGEPSSIIMPPATSNNQPLDSTQINKMVCWIENGMPQN